jgi:cytochrome c oxidase cbb3-type subunit 3
MRPRNSLAVAAILLLTCLAGRLMAQGQPPAPAPAPQQGLPGQPPAQGPGQGGRGRGQATFPAQQRTLADPAMIARGKTLFEINCRLCHGADLRGGDMGGANLLRSNLVLTAQHGELILPVVKGGRQNPGMPVMPPFPQIPDDDVKAPPATQAFCNCTASEIRVAMVAARRSSSQARALTTWVGRPEA